MQVVVGKRHRRARWRILHDKGRDSCTAVLFILMEGGFFFFYSIACLHRVDKVLDGQGYAYSGLAQKARVGWMGGSEGNGATLGDLSIRRMKQGGIKIR